MLAQLHNNYTRQPQKLPTKAGRSWRLVTLLVANCLFGAREKFPYFDLECSFVSLLGQNLNPSLSLVGFWTITTLFPRFNPILFPSACPVQGTNLPVVGFDKTFDFSMMTVSSPVLGERPSSQMSFLDQFLKESSVSRHTTPGETSPSFYSV